MSNIYYEVHKPKPVEKTPERQEIDFEDLSRVITESSIIVAVHNCVPHMLIQTNQSYEEMARDGMRLMWLRLGAGAPTLKQPKPVPRTEDQPTMRGDGKANILSAIGQALSQSDGVVKLFVHPTFEALAHAYLHVYERDPECGNDDLDLSNRFGEEDL